SVSARLVQQCRHHLRFVRAQLEAIGAALVCPAHVGTGLLGCVYRTSIPTRSRTDVGEQPGSDDLVPPASAGLRQRPVHAVAGTGIANGGDAVTEPELVDILRRSTLAGAADVSVKVHEAGQYVHSTRVDFACGTLRPAARVYLGAGASDAANRGDAIPLDDDVHRAD